MAYRILFLHGFTSSGDCEIARTLTAELEGAAEVAAPDLPLHPSEAMAMLQDLCDDGRFDLIVGSSCGAFYGQQLVRLTGVPAILVSPFLKMTEFLEPRIGVHQYKSPRADGRQQFVIDTLLIGEFAAMEQHQFDCYDEFNRLRVRGMFGSQDNIAHFRDLFCRYYHTAIDYDGPHTMTAANVRRDLVPQILTMLAEVRPMRERHFRHFKGGLYRLWHFATDSETLQRRVVYQVLYGRRGFWVRPELMFFERITRDGKTFPRFAEIPPLITNMPTDFSIRQERAADREAVVRLIELAFRDMSDSDHSEHLLVDRLRPTDAFIPGLSLVAESGGRIIGHLLMTKAAIVSAGDGRIFPTLALAPVAVLPASQRQGVGSALIREAHRRAAALGYASAVVLGHKDYYPRFGYRHADTYGITFPFDVPHEFCMAAELRPGGLKGVRGTVRYAPPFME